MVGTGHVSLGGSPGPCVCLAMHTTSGRDVIILLSTMSDSSTASQGQGGRASSRWGPSHHCLAQQVPGWYQRSKSARWRSPSSQESSSASEAASGHGSRHPWPRDQAPSRSASLVPSVCTPASSVAASSASPSPIPGAGESQFEGAWGEGSREAGLVAALKALVEQFADPSWVAGGSRSC